jgi:hypothetical protein
MKFYLSFSLILLFLVAPAYATNLKAQVLEEAEELGEEYGLLLKEIDQLPAVRDPYRDPDLAPQIEEKAQRILVRFAETQNKLAELEATQQKPIQTKTRAQLAFSYSYVLAIALWPLYIPTIFVGITPESMRTLWALVAFPGIIVWLNYITSITEGSRSFKVIYGPARAVYQHIGKNRPGLATQRLARQIRERFLKKAAASFGKQLPVNACELILRKPV